TLLIGHPGVTWRDWLKDNRKNRPLLCLDPTDPIQGVPAQLCLLPGSKPSISRFFGSLDAQRAPHVMIALVAEALRDHPDDLIVQLFPYRPI
ncbi:hypothetical protein ABTM70_19190, partial [Acinetobacter baumannii]